MPISEPSFTEFVKLARRKIANHPRIREDMKEVFQMEITDILADDFFDNVSKQILIMNFLRKLKIPIGVEGAGLRRRGFYKPY